ncbi:hypothetical protein IWW39_003331 [Coemansia spiralis]|uniref:Tyrosinase copper-binding domain-containing protein n=1 Tax=Coemansia spiralis TaxID=417178 RepID=A0A9W8GJI5_9FUNG|nr:hypothetical protein IWW39_003331 [Coemansia spiralis]
MKLFVSTLAAAVFGLSALNTADAQQNQPACSSVYTRPELLSLTPAQWTNTRNVLSAMQRDGWFGWFAYLHNQWFSQIHGNSQFFPFHRRFVHDWESVGRRYSGSFVQPYWDEMRDYRVPAASQVLTSNWVGGNGQGANRCVTNGNQGGWTMSFPSNHCFSRNFGNNGNPTSWYSPEYIQSFIQRDTTMAQFRPDIEYSLHGVVHINIGGDMLQGYSPNDWIFMLHHTNIDRLWWQWQLNNRMWTMDGPNFDNSAISLDTNIAYYNQPIRSVMQLGYGSMCYQYASNPIRRRALDSGLESALINSLPKDVLSAWFPDTAKKPAIVALRPPPPLASAAPGVSSGSGMPYPAKLTQQWIQMHKYNKADVDKVESDARKFVDAMNKAGYRSPV